MDTNRTRAWNVGIAAGALLAIFLLVLTLKEAKELFVGDTDLPATNIISVVGKGEAVTIPDIATFTLTVTESDKAIVDAQKRANDKIDAVIKSLKDTGIAEKDIKTLSYNINPRYEYMQEACTALRCPPGKSVLTGYEVSQSLEVKVRDLAKAGTILSSAGSLGVQNVSGLNFTVDDEDMIREKAQADAIADAKQKAEKLARDLGVRLVKIVSFSEFGGGYPMPYAADMKMGRSEAVTNQAAPAQVPQGEAKITSQVQISYEIR